MRHNTTQLLFSYGTLQHEEVQIATFGRRLERTSDALVEYRVVTIEVQDQEFVVKAGSQQRNLQYTGDKKDVVEGMVLRLTQQELEQADAYEPAEYKRKLVQLRSGATAWVYLTNIE